MPGRYSGAQSAVRNELVAFPSRHMFYISVHPTRQQHINMRILKRMFSLIETDFAQFAVIFFVSGQMFHVFERDIEDHCATALFA